MIKRNLKRVFLAVVMVMTAALSAVAEEQAKVTCTAIEGTSGFNNNESYAKLVDGDTKTKWCCPFGSSVKSVYVVFKTSMPVILTGYSFTTANDNDVCKGRNPKNWTISGSNTNGDWTTIATVEGDETMDDVNFTQYNFTITNNVTLYSYYKVEVTETRGAKELQISEMGLDYKICDHKSSSGESAMTVKDVAATCTERAHKEHECSICGQKTKVDYEGEYAEHSYEGGVCSVCGSEKVEVPAAVDGYYQIDNFEKLIWFVNVCHGKIEGEGIDKAKLTGSIAIPGEYKWKGINNFKGEIDGQGNAITGLKDAPLVLINNGLIKNIVLNKVDLTSSSFEYLGAVCNQNNGEINNCSVSGKVISTYGGICYAGAICGYMNSTRATIKRCVNYANVKSESYSAGICGVLRNGLVEACVNKGKVSSNTSACGIVGEIRPGVYREIKSCLSLGDLEGRKIRPICTSLIGEISKVSEWKIMYYSTAPSVSEAPYIPEESTAPYIPEESAAPVEPVEESMAPVVLQSTGPSLLSALKSLFMGDDKEAEDKTMKTAELPESKVEESKAVYDQSNVTNCYYSASIYSSEDINGCGKMVTEEELKSGKVAYMLQTTYDDVNKMVWGQVIGEDDAPILTVYEDERVTHLIISGEIEEDLYVNNYVLDPEYKYAWNGTLEWNGELYGGEMKVTAYKGALTEVGSCVATCSEPAYNIFTTTTGEKVFQAKGVPEKHDFVNRVCTKCGKVHESLIVSCLYNDQEFTRREQVKYFTLQFIIPGEALAAVKAPITSLTLLTEYEAEEDVEASVNLFVGNIDGSKFDSWDEYGYGENEVTKVCDNAKMVISRGGKTNILFGTPFEYDGASNLAVVLSVAMDKAVDNLRFICYKADHSQFIYKGSATDENVASNIQGIFDWIKSVIPSFELYGEEHVIKAVPAKESTTTCPGHIAGYECTLCGKHYSDAEGENEIADELWYTQVATAIEAIEIGEETEEHIEAIYDVMGRLVPTTDVRSLSRGVYVVKTNNGSRKITVK